MKKILLSLSLSLPLLLGSSPSGNVEWNKIRHWAGSGDNKAALLVQFPDCDKTYVWGYRWNSGFTPDGETMLRSIAGESSDLDVLMQYTGSMGYTLNGIGYSNNHSVLKHLYYDFGAASQDANISFGFYTPNTGMGQTSAPGTDAIDMAAAAIEGAASSHVIEHPLNAREFGYAAYDYDHWQLSSQPDGGAMWKSGWYNGYWSYWYGTDDLSTLGYSGVGMTSTTVSDGDVQAWAYMNLNGGVDAASGATLSWGNLDYDHFLAPAGIINIVAPADNLPVTVYDGSGRVIGMLNKDEMNRLAPGFYIVKQGTATSKIIIK